MKLQCVKQAAAFRPANEIDLDSMKKIKNGSLVQVDVVQPRNPYFHRKFFALINLGFEYFEPECEPYKGIVPQKNSERFRKDVTIMAGYYDVVVNIKGETRLEAKSISFGSMEEGVFNELYSAVFNVIWNMVLSKINGFTKEQAENTINQLLSFD